LFHNSKLVGEITRNINTKILVSPSPGDAGSSIGASYFAMLCLGKKYTITIMKQLIDGISILN
jgi:predicted NodU family carbamoyl transferase